MTEDGCSRRYLPLLKHCTWSWFGCCVHYSALDMLSVQDITVERLIESFPVELKELVGDRQVCWRLNIEGEWGNLKTAPNFFTHNFCTYTHSSVIFWCLFSPSSGHYFAALSRQLAEIDELRRAEALKLPDNLPYERCARVLWRGHVVLYWWTRRLNNMSAECREKLALVKPTTVRKQVWSRPFKTCSDPCSLHSAWCSQQNTRTDSSCSLLANDLR